MVDRYMRNIGSKLMDWPNGPELDQVLYQYLSQAYSFDGSFVDGPTSSFPGIQKGLGRFVLPTPRAWSESLRSLHMNSGWVRLGPKEGLKGFIKYC